MQSSLFDTPEQNAPTTWEIITLDKAELQYRERHFSAEQSKTILARLMNTTNWRQDSLNFKGKSVTVPRLQAWYGDAGARYGYSGIHLNPLPWTPLLTSIRTSLEDTLGHPFNSVLLNLYRDGQDSVAWHSDDEKELGENPVIASLSFGASRRLELKPKPPQSGEKIHLTLHDGSLLFMGKGLQRHWSHQIPKEPGITLPRINLTFRFIRAMA